MKEYLSHGGGVNSTALMILLTKEKREFESIFVDHGGDYPETYEYIEYLQKHGYPITILKPDIGGCVTLEEYCNKHRIKPLRQRRWCSDKFKIRPIRGYIKTPCIMNIGMDAGESHRAVKKPIKKGVYNQYPLIGANLNRKDCIDIIQTAGLKIPMKSGCWFCPFQTPREVKELRKNYPGLYLKRKEIMLVADKAYAQRHYNLLSNFQSD